MISTGVCRWLFLVISLSTWKILLCSKEMRVVCYYTNWSVYRPGAAKFSPQNINPYMCTHLIYAFGGFTKENTLKPFDKYQDIEKGGYAKFTGLKTYNKNLKTMLAIGGWNEGSSRFSPMVANPERRREFVKNAIKFLRLNHFDGLDLDWEYPSFRDGGKSRDRDNYAQLVQDLREEFDRESSKTGRTRLLLTMAVPAGIQYINKGYDVPKLTKYLDWMNILSYDYHSAFEPAVNHHAPLYSLEEDSEYNYDGDLNIDHTIKHYLELGAEPNKLVLGIPTYGRSYTLFNPDAFEIGSPADGPGEMGEATRENGYLAYYEICDYVKNQDWEVEQPNSKAMGPYAFKEDQWVGYDDEDIVRRKAEYVAENNLGGIMFWAIDNDDFRGDCHGKAYPLIEAGREALLKAYGLTDDNQIVPPSKPQKSRRKRPNKSTNKVNPSEETHVKNEKSTPISRRRNRIKPVEKEESINETKTKRKLRRKNSKISDDEEPISYSSLKVVTPSYTTPSPPSTPDMGGAFKCEDEGFFQHPKDCKKYFWCLSGAGDSGIVAHAFTCPAGLYFNKAADSCDYSQNVICNKKMQKTSTASTKGETTSTSATFVSTTRTPPKITAATSRTTFKQTTTTTEAPEDEYEYEDDEDVDENIKSDTEEEDPRVIKELIDLIKKAGGIEELEKQLRIPNGNSSSQSIKFTTQSPISQSLYEKVINKAIKNTTGTRKLYSSMQNSRGPQTDGLTAKKENSSTQPKTSRGKLSYTSISRSRPIISESTEDKDGNESENSEKTRKPTGKPNSVEYVNIRRPRISTTTSEPDNNSLFSRNKFLGETEVEENESEYEDEEDDEDTDINVPKKQTFIPHYTNIRRQKPTTEEVPSSSMYSDIRITSTESPVETKEESDPSTTSKYKQFLRRTITTTSTTTDPPSSTIDETHSYRSKSTPANSSESGNVEASSKRYIQLRRGTTTERSSNESDKAIGSTQTTISTDVSSENRNDSSYVNNVLETSGVHSPKDNNITTETETNKISIEDNIHSTTLPTTILSGDTLSNMKIRQVSDSKSTSSPVTESATQTSKVSQPNFRYRYRSKIDTPQYSANIPSSQNIARSTSRFRPETQGIESKKINDRTPVPQRRRLISTTEKYVEEIRSYRPTELADLSSLTAVDFSKIKEFHLGQSPNRRRRPVSSSFDTANYEEPADSQKNNSRPPKSSFNKSRRLVEGNGNQTQSVSESNKKYRRITFGTIEESAASKNISKNTESSTYPRNRKIIRRYRPSTRNPVDSNEEYKKTLNENITSSRQNLSVPANNQQQPSSLNENDIETENDDSFEDSNIDDDDDENIKLSESNIRENSAINSFGSDPKFERTTFRRGNLQKSSEPAKSITTEKYDSDIEINRTNEPGVRTRRRKIIRKITPTSAPPNYIDSEVSNRKRKIIRKLGPVSGFNKAPETHIYDENDEGDKDNNTPKSTSIPALEADLTTRSSQQIQAKSNSSVENSYEDADPAGLSDHESDNTEENTEYNEITTTEKVTPKYVNKLFKLRQNDGKRRFKNVEVSSTTEKTFSSTPRYKGYSRRPSYSNRKPMSTEKITTERDEELHIHNEINEPTRGYIRKNSIESSPTTLTYDYVTERHNLMKNLIINDNTSSNNPTTETTTNEITETVSTESIDENITTEPPTTEFESSHQREVPTTELATLSSTTIFDEEINTNTIDTTKYDGIIQDDLSATHVTTDNIITILTDESTDFTSSNIITTEGITDDPLLSTEISTSDGISSTTSAELTSHRASTLRSINLRPKYVPSKLKELSATNPTESANILKTTRFYGRTRSQFKPSTESSKVSEDRVVSENDSTTERAKNKIGKFKNGFRSELQANRNQLSTTSTTRPKNTNSYKFSTSKNIEDKFEDTIGEQKVVNDKGESAINRFANIYTSSKPTQGQSITEESLKIDTEAVRNRNRNLFTRKRVMNIPVSVAKIAKNSTKDEETSSHSSTTVASSILSSSSETTILPATELLQSSEEQTTTEFPTTLHHIFAQIIGETESTTQSIASKENLANKQERLIEVSRIVNVNTKEEKVKHNHVEQTTDEISSILDKIGAINRVTSIKVVDVDGMTKHDHENFNTPSPIFVHPNDSDDVTTPDSPIKSSVDMIIQIAKVQEVPPPNSQQKVNLTNINVEINTSGISDQLFSNRENRKIDIFGKSKISDSKTNNIYFQKADIIDGRSHINIVTPRPIYNAEASTISLEGLFHADESPLFNRNSALNDEVLESENSKFVNVRVLHPDESVKLKEGLKENDKVIPIKILKQDEDDIATKAKVVEISPMTHLNTIKIIPIRVEMSRLIANNLPLIGSSRTKSIPT